MLLRYAIAVGAFLVVISTGCGNEDLVFPGMPLPTVEPSVSPTPCENSGASCTFDSDCCSGVCSGGICE